MKDKKHSPGWQSPTARLHLYQDNKEATFFGALKPLMDNAVDIACKMPDLKEQVGHLMWQPTSSAIQAISACKDIRHYLKDHLGFKVDEHPTLDLLLIRLEHLILQAAFDELQRLGRILPDAKERIKNTRGHQQGGQQKNPKRHALWEKWCNKALEIRQKHPNWSCLRVARKIKEDDGYKDAVNTIRLRIAHLFQS